MSKYNVDKVYIDSANPSIIICRHFCKSFFCCSFVLDYSHSYMFHRSYRTMALITAGIGRGFTTTNTIAATVTLHDLCFAGIDLQVNDEGK